MISLLCNENRMPGDVNLRLRPFLCDNRLTFSTHCDSVGNPNCVELPSQHALFLDCGFHRLSEFVY
jgi:hypothetical protein